MERPSQSSKRRKQWLCVPSNNENHNHHNAHHKNTGRKENLQPKIATNKQIAILMKQHIVVFKLGVK